MASYYRHSICHATTVVVVSYCTTVIFTAVSNSAPAPVSQPDVSSDTLGSEPENHQSHSVQQQGHQQQQQYR